LGRAARRTARRTRCPQPNRRRATALFEIANWISEVADLQRALKTVEAADLTVDKGEVVGLVGESR